MGNFKGKKTKQNKKEQTNKTNKQNKKTTTKNIQSTAFLLSMAVPTLTVHEMEIQTVSLNMGEC